MKSFLIPLALSPGQLTSSPQSAAPIPIDEPQLRDFIARGQGPGIWILEKEDGDDDEIVAMLEALDVGKLEKADLSTTVYRLVIGLEESDELLAARLLDIGADEVQFGHLMRGPLMDARIRSLIRRGADRARSEYVHARLEEAQQLGNLGNWRYDVATDHTWWSTQVYRIAGLDPSLPAPSLREYGELIPGQDREIFLRTVEEAIAQGQGYDIEHRLLRHDGSLRVVHCMSRPVFDGDQIVALTGVIQDVTERRQVEEALRRRDEILTYISNELPAALYQCRLDTQGRMWMDYLSPGRMTGLLSIDPQAPVPMEKIFDQAFIEDRPQLRESILYSAMNLTPWEEEFRIVTGQGTLRWMQARSSPVRLTDGTIIWYGVVSDITSRKSLEEQLHRADRLASIGTLAAGIAHEINNPLAFVLSNIEFAREEFLHLHDLDDASDAFHDLGETLKTAYEGARRIGAIVQGLMGFARHDAENNDSVDLREVIGAALRIVHNELRKRIELDVDFDRPLYGRGNEGQICQVLINLLLNAIQAMPEDRREGNRIALRMMNAPDKMIAIEILDTGVGIDEETRKRLFDPFFSTKPVGQGTGLGLYVCHNLIDAMDGRLEIESTPGEGTLARVLLPEGEPPAVVSDADEARAEEAYILRHNGQQRARILIVDDEPDLVEAVMRSLRQEHDVTGFATSAEALAAVDEGERYDAVLLDVLMPQMDGIELFQRLTEEHPDLEGHIGFLSGGAFKEHAQRFLKDRQPPCLSKPFRVQELRRFVQNLLEAEHIQHGS